MSAIIWVDVETTGTDPFEDSLLEIAAMATDMAGEPISTLKEFVISQPHIEPSTDLVLKMHEKSGLWKDLWEAEPIQMTEVDSLLSEWVDSLELDSKETFFGGNSITLDREFVAYNLPGFYQRFSHRSVDVTSIALALQGNFDFQNFRKDLLHRAGSDVLESIEEYKFYMSKISA